MLADLHVFDHDPVFRGLPVMDRFGSPRNRVFHLEARDALNARYTLEGKMDSPTREDPFFTGQLTVTGPHGYINVFETQTGINPQ